MRVGVSGIVGVAAALVLASVPPAEAQTRRTKPTAAAPAKTPAIARDVRIRRDTFGVPHILGRTDADAAFGIGFAHSEDDFPTMQEGLMTARGQLASVKGASGVETDWMYHLMDIRRLVDQRYTTDLPADVRAVVEAYAEGVNAYAALHPDKSIPGRAPFTGKDVVAYGIYRGPTFYGLDDVFEGLMKSAPKLARQDADVRSSVGSNAVAIAPSRTPDGATRLLVNSHQPFVGPFSWYEAVIQSGQGWHVAGAFFPGSPFLLGGHTPTVGWAPTVNRPDLHDVYKLTVNPANPDEYQLDGAWRRFDKRFAEIQVKQADGTMKTERREVLRSAHGPAIRNAEGVFAVRYPGMNDARAALQYYRMNKARTFEEWKAAMALGAIPSINYVYADARGNIGILPNARHPVRKEGIDWSGVVPGDRSDLIWTEELPFARRPQLWNPKSGYVFNANNTPFRASDPADDISPINFSKTLGLQTYMTNRALRSAEVYGGDTSITAEEFDRYKYDDAYSPVSQMSEVIKELLAVDASADPQLQEAQRIIRAWDRRTNTGNRNAALPVITAMLLRDPQIQPRTKPGPPAAAVLKQVAGLLQAAHGRLDPEWGEVNRIRRGSVDLPVDGGPDIFRAIYGRPDAKGRLEALVGDSYFMLVEWDRQGRLSSRSIHQFGSATLDATSPHYADQTPLFAARKTKPVLFTEAELRGQIVEDYRPGQRQPRR